MSLAYGLSKMNSYSTNYFRLETTNLTEASRYSTITLNLPVNSIVNMKSLSMHCLGSCTTPLAFTNDAGDADELITTLPNGIEKLIQRMEIFAGGQQLTTGFQGYNTVSCVLDTIKTTLSKEMTYQRVLKNQEINTTENFYSEPRPYILNQWLSFLGEAEPSYIDTSLLPICQLRLYMAGPEVLGCYQKSKGPGVQIDTKAQETLVAQGNFKLEKLYFTVETITFSSGVYDAAVESKLRDGFLEIPYYNYFTFFEGASTMDKSTRFSLSSQCINNIYAVQRRGDYREKNKGLIKLTNTMGPDYIPSYFQFSAGGLGSFQFNINNLFVPNYRVEPLAGFNLLTIGKADNYGVLSGCKINSYEDWLNNQFIAMVRLNLPSEMGVRSMTSLDSRGLNSSFYLQCHSASPADPLQTVDLSNSNETMIICETTAVLRIGQNRVIETVF